MTRQISTITSLMAFLGLWAFALTGSAGPLFITIVAIAYAAGLLSHFKRRVQIPSRAWNIIAVPVFALFLADYLFFSGDIIASGSGLIAVLLGLKLFDLRKNRDYLLAYALVFFQILAAAASTVSLAFFVLLALYVMASIWAMILFNMLSDLNASARRMSAPSDLFGPGFFAVVAALTALSLVVTLALFFFIPRMGVGIFQRKSVNTLKVTGFSDTVDLGSLGPVKEDSTIVMRAEFPAGRPKGTVYFKGVTLLDYDGKSWSREQGNSFIKRAGPEGFYLGSGQGKSTEFSILLEPLDTEVLFTAPNIYRLEGSFPAVWVERSGVLRLPSPPFSRVEYRAWTDLSRVNGAEPAPKDGVADKYLESSPEGGKISALAGEIAQGKTAFEKASAIEKYLKANYNYTLSPRTKGGSGPLEDFLFYSKEGYCEHFATSMVMLLRASGIPSRLVTGFLEGEWNELGGYFIVRQQDAHSWVEAYIDGVGWMRFDPTPSVPTPAHRPSILSLYLDLMKLKWNRYIIQFSFSDQRRMALSAERKAADILEGIRTAFRNRKAPEARDVLPFAAGIAALILVILLRRVSRKKAYLKGPGFYFDMLKTLAKRGMEKRPAETPLEFARRVNDRRVTDITEAFQMERYGHVKAGKADLEKIRAALRELKKG